MIRNVAYLTRALGTLPVDLLFGRRSLSDVGGSVCPECRLFPSLREHSPDEKRSIPNSLRPACVFLLRLIRLPLTRDLEPRATCHICNGIRRAHLQAFE